MIVVVLAVIGSGLAVLAWTWPSLGLSALLLAPVVGSTIALLTGLLLAYLRSRNPRAPVVRIGVSDSVIPDPPLNDPLPTQKRAS